MPKLTKHIFKREKLHRGRWQLKRMPWFSQRLCLCFTHWKLWLKATWKKGSTSTLWICSRFFFFFSYNCLRGCIVTPDKRLLLEQKNVFFFSSHVICNKTILWSLNELSQLKKNTDNFHYKWMSPIHSFSMEGRHATVTYCRPHFIRYNLFHYSCVCFIWKMLWSFFPLTKIHIRLSH